MEFKYLANKIGYPCIFAASTEEAACNLVRLITGKQCGYDEGREWWILALKDCLEGQHDLLALNWCGASFSEVQWRTILCGVLDGLRESHAGPSDF